MSKTLIIRFIILFNLCDIVLLIYLIINFNPALWIPVKYIMYFIFNYFIICFHNIVYLIIINLYIILLIAVYIYK